MDHILEGVLKSNHPDSMKRQLIDKIREKGQGQHPANDVKGVLNLSMNWFLQGDTELQVKAGLSLFQGWSQHHVGALEGFLSRDLLVNLITNPSKHQANLPILLTHALQLMRDHGNPKTFQQHLKIVEAKAPTFVQESVDDIVPIKNYLQMLLDFKDNLPKVGELAGRLALPLMQALASVQIPADEHKVHQFIKDVTLVTDFLQQIWSQSTSTLPLDRLRDLFNIISALDGAEPSVCLGSVVRLIPTDVVESAVKSAVNDTRITDGAVNAALRRMIDWLVWPTCRNLDHWVICFLKELAAAKKFTILIDVTESKVEQVMEKVRYLPVREAGFNILSHMLLSFQHSPQAFHKVLQSVPETLDILAKEDSESARACRIKLATLLHYLMYLHTGFPELYDPILDLIKDVPCPSSDDINSKLAQSRWSGQQCSGNQALMATDLVEKSDTGKTGIFNLGNTCYMNSILQTLFMCDDFRRQTLARTASLEEGLLHKLQGVFASLLLSQRPAVAPMKFLTASRPPWFVQGQQQDCSEFLKFLLDQLHEQQLEANKKQAKVANGHVPNGKIPNGSPAKSKDSVKKVENGVVPNGHGSCRVGGASSSHKAESEKDSTLVGEVFGGKVRSTLRCLSCKQESHRVEDFTDIPLAFPDAAATSSSSPISPKSLVGGGAHLPQGDRPKQQEPAADCTKEASTEPTAGKTAKATHLNELLSHYLSPERMEGDNQYHCDRCGRLQDGERTISIIDSPRYLILTLLRFAYDTKQQTRSKVFREVTCPRTLALPVQPDTPDTANSSTAAKRRKKLLNHLNPKLPPSVSPSPENCELYGLCSVVVHSGASSECGHYYCYSRHSHATDVDSVIDSLDKSVAAASCSSATEADRSASEVDFLEDKWCLFNDARVSPATYASFSSVTKRFEKDTPYVLVYRKLSLHSQDSKPQGEPPLSQELRDEVNKDNTQYLKEQELAAKARASRKRSASTSSTTFDHWHDSDSDQGPPGSCGGGGGLGGMGNSGPRFVC
ncbi:ubiquitin carboxyl-terminal hydrolase 38-like isoform X2 [Littorina saxatilis]